MDAVFYFNIYKQEEIFRQEGWNYQLETEQDPLKYNGVVYNEMKGRVFSSAAQTSGAPDIALTLFSRTLHYGVKSGGDPEYIPDLTYEQFLDFHRRYYHPSNSYIYLYGDMDMEEKLIWIKREYLSRFSVQKTDSAIRLQKPFKERVEKIIEYPVGEQEDVEENTYLTCSMVTGDGLDVEKGIAFQVLEYALLDAPGAPLKQALLDAGLGKDVIGSYEDGIYQPFFTIMAKNARIEDKDRFAAVIEEQLRETGGRGD